MTDKLNTDKRNWLCYDADCAFCVRWAKRFGTLLEKHNFGLLPLQSAAVRTALGVPEEELLKEMRVITRHGDIFGGADALIYLSQFICKPLFPLTRIPGVKPLLRAIYRVIASNRNCNSSSCRVHRTTIFRVGNPVDWLPLLIMVLAAAAIGIYVPAWIYMWAIAVALFAGFKWLSFRKEMAKGTEASLALKLGFLFGWIGMDAGRFFATPTIHKKPLAAEWFAAIVKILFGAALIWVATRRALIINPLLAGWTGMFGLILLLHFGLFHLLALAWRTAGIPVTPLMRAPLLARSLGEFWGERWNTAFNKLAEGFLFRPLLHPVGVRAATMLVFLVSGLVHDFVISVPARGGYGLPTLYFLLQGAGVLFEHTRLARRCGLNRNFRGWLFTLIVTAGPVFWLFHPTFIRNVILPFLKCIGAT